MERKPFTADPETRSLIERSLQVVVVLGAALHAAVFISTFVDRRATDRVASSVVERATCKKLSREAPRCDSQGARSLLYGLPAPLKGAIVPSRPAAQSDSSYGAAHESRSDNSLLPEDSEAPAEPDGGFDVFGVLKDNLIREVRIFTASNAALFLLSAALLVLRRQRDAWDRLPAYVLIVSVCLSIAVYAVSHDWAWMVLTSDHMGYWYLAIVGTWLLLFSDVVWNEADATRALLNHLHNW